MILPTLPLAACFAFGAALGPTDAVAVGSLSGRIDIPERSMNILSGEGLIDASGVTAFQFALAALLTGSFSPVSGGPWLFPVLVERCRNRVSSIKTANCSFT